MTTTPTPGASAQGFLLGGVGFETPESVLYDAEADVYLVANINGGPSDKDGNGFISRISPGGKVIALKWIDGAAEGVTLNAPKGLALSGERLFVADIDVVRVFDRESGVWLEEIPVNGARFLNDVAASEEGMVYVTDSGTGVVHRIMPDGSLEQVGQLKNPNGIQVRGETILVAGGSNQIFRLGEDGALTLEYEAPAGGLDGLILLGDEGVLVSSWMGAAVYQFDADGQVSELFGGINAPADIGFDSRRNVVLIPHFEDDRVEARPLPSHTPAPTLTVAAFELTRDVPYIADGHPKQKLDIYLPASGDRPFSTLLAIHGGGVDKINLTHVARHFVERGYAVISINYRDMSLFDYPAPVQDVFCALAWTHANADTYGFDAGRIVVLGHSAGGTLTAMLGTVDDPDLFTGDCPHQLPQADWVQGAVPFTGVFDYTSAVQTSPERRLRVERYLGARLDQDPETWTQASAATWVDGSEPPFLLIHGTEDEVFATDESVEFAEILEQAGVDVELLLIPGADHGAIINSEQSFEAVENFLATLAETSTSTPIPLSEPVAGAGVKTYGGPLNDRAFDVLLTADGGALIAGLANNTRLSHRITPGNAHLIRTDSEGDIIWEKDYGGENDAVFSSIIRAGEEEYVLLGEIAASYSRDETDVYLVKVDGEGNEIWSHTYGGRGMDLGTMVRQTADGGYVLIGDTADEFPTRNVYQSKMYLIKTDADGNEVWSRTYGDHVLYLGWGVAQTPDGGYVLTGWEAKTIDDRDVIAIKTNEVGDVEWSRTWDLGPGERDGGFDLILTSDGHVVMACIQSMGSGAPSAVLLKVDLDGNEIWNKLIGEEGVGNTFWHIMEDADGGYVMAGDTHLGKVPATGQDIHGGLMIKTDADGEVLWQRIFGEGQYEQASFNAAAVLPDGEYVFVGRVTQHGERYSDMLWFKTRHE
jgi:acetyl esterase/lipase